MTDHIGDSTQMVPMTQERLDEIKWNWKKDPKYGWPQPLDRAVEDLRALLAEVERLRAYIQARETAQVTHYCENCEANAQARKAAEDEVERLRAERRWIPVGEILPPEPDLYRSHVYNVLTTEGLVLSMNYETQMVRGKKVSRWTWSGRIPSWEVTHWMPLPDPIGRKEGRVK